MRLRGLIRKESLQILRDPSSIAIAFVMPVVLLLLFGFGVSLDAKNIRLALVVERADENTASLTGAFQHSDFFIPVSYSHIQQAEQALRDSRDELEMRVQERTSELSRANELLLAEIAERRRVEDDLRTSEERFRQLAENIDKIFWMMEPQLKTLLRQPQSLILLALILSSLAVV